MPNKTVHEELKIEAQKLAAASASATEFMERLTLLLHERMLKYNWVGFYLIENSIARAELVLGPFRGAMTPHTRIPMHQGICGAAASTGKTVVVDDVSKDPRYLACSLETKSEIVAPVFVRGNVVGELDIDSHFPAAFGGVDRDLVEHCASLAGQCFEKSAH